MKPIDLLLCLLLPTTIILHALVAPYTKVEESFNLQATHDLVHHSPLSSIQNFDHLTFPGAVPRTFVGALLLALLSKPILFITDTEYSIKYAQIIVRSVLGLLNAAALIRYKNGLEEAFGTSVGRWYVVLQASQFHVIYYASRTLPNMFAFILTTLALREFLPTFRPVTGAKRQTRGIIFLVLAGVIFRAEIALLLFTQLGHLLVRSRVSLQTIIPAGLGSALAALAVSVPLDSYLWQRPIWPELAGFYYNAIEGKSADWGTSPYFYYFNTLIPGLLNPLMLMVLIPLSFLIPATRYSAREFIEPSAFFVAIYSLQPHKESRFIIYIVPALTATAALSASYISTRRSKSLFYQLGSLLIALAVMVCFAASTLKLLISSLNYPGGEALSTLHSLLNQNSSLIPTVGGQGMVRIHMDVLSCMTGISRFQQYPSVAFDTEGSLALDYVPEIAGVPTLITYDKTEESDKLLDPKLWNTFDFALMEDPGKAIGAWETIGVIYAYAGIEFLRPGQDSAVRDLEAIYEANNLTTEDNKTLGSQDIRDKVEELKEVKTARTEARSLGELKETLLGGNLSRYQIYRLVKDATRSVTGGWWIGPRMESKIRILRRIKDPL